jgi:hypothetical protein
MRDSKVRTGRRTGKRMSELYTYGPRGSPRPLQCASLPKIENPRANDQVVMAVRQSGRLGGLTSRGGCTDIHADRYLLHDGGYR